MNSVEDNAAKQYELPKWEFNRNADPKEIDLQNKIIVLSRAGTDIQLIICSILLDPSKLLLNRKRVIVCSKRKSKNVDSNAPKTSISKWNRPPKRCSRWSERSKTSFSTKVSSKKSVWNSTINFSPDVSSSSSSENDLASAGRKQKLQNYIQKLRNRNKQLFSNNDYAAPPVTRPPVVRTTIRTTTTMAPVRRQYMDYGDRIVLT